MRKFAILLIGFVMFSCEKISKNEFPVEHFSTMVEIKNQKLKEALNDYSLENLPEEGKGVVMVDFRNNDDTSTFIIYSSMSEDLKKSPPSYYTILRKVPILFYTGLESHILFDSLYLDNLDKDVSPFLVRYIEDDQGNILQVPPNYNPPVWRIEIVADSLIKKEVLN
jgi:hypothetical protein